MESNGINNNNGGGGRLRWWHLPFLAVLVIGTIAVVGGDKPTPYIKERGTVFGTIYNVTYQSPVSLQGDIEAALAEVDASLSMFNPHSTIALVNAAEGEVAVGDDSLFCRVMSLARHVSEQTGGAFDITVAPLVNAWGFGTDGARMPDSAQVDSLLAITGYRMIEMRGDTIVKGDPRVRLDCSAIAKGLGSDRVALMMERRGVGNFMIEIGGEMVVRGVNDKGEPWRIGVAKPVDDTLALSQEVDTVMRLSNAAIATSGNYRNFYYKDGKKYAHTIDPHTGYPVQHNILSSTVIAPDCATADAYATAFMVMGLEGAQEVVKRHPELKVYFICNDDEGRLYTWTSE